MEKGPRAGKLRLCSIPGLRAWKQLADGPVRCLWSNPGGNQLFAIGGGRLWEVFNDGTPNSLQGNVGNGTNPAIIVSNGFQLAIASAGEAYISPGPGVVAPIIDTTGQPVDAATIAFMDQYFIAAIRNTKRVQISDLAPAGGVWDPGNAAIKEGYSDNIVRIWQDNEQLWLFGNETTEIWIDTGGLFPFQRAASALFQIGCDSAWSVAGQAGIRFWLWSGIVWAATGQQPFRVSDFGVEQAIKSYSYFDQTNAEGFSYLQGGHIFYSLNFPESGANWTYDYSTKMWHERLFWNVAQGRYTRYRPRVYARAFGKDLVGDFETGWIYEMDPTFFTDAGGDTLRRQRIAPYFTDQMRNVRYNRLTLDVDTGVGLDLPPGSRGQDPQIMMRYSRNRGKIWSATRQASLGEIGDYDRRVFWTQMGSARIGMAVEVTVSDPVTESINGAYMDLGAGTMAKT